MVLVISKPPTFRTALIEYTKLIINQKSFAVITTNISLLSMSLSIVDVKVIIRKRYKEVVVKCNQCMMLCDIPTWIRFADETCLEQFHEEFQSNQIAIEMLNLREEIKL